VSVDLREQGVDLVLLDIEGTTTPIAYVYDVLFPYARARLAGYLRTHAGDERVRDLLATLRVEWQDDARRGEQPPDWAHADVPAAARYFEWLMDRDRKSPALKRVQGEIWEGGFRDGTLRSDLFPDVVPAFARWTAAGIAVAIYSSGSVLAQRLIFSGQLDSVAAFFDTGVGPKRSADSYRRIARELAREPKRMLFVSDVGEELDAARAAGFQVLLAIRPGNRPATGEYDAIRSFDELLA